jgi:transcriptional regulator with XRE-family HTH domain
VPGLRREEIASLAGVSVEYYKRMEHGNPSGLPEARIWYAPCAHPSVRPEYFSADNARPREPVRATDAGEVHCSVVLLGREASGRRRG